MSHDHGLQSTVKGKARMTCAMGMSTDGDDHDDGAMRTSIDTEVTNTTANHDMTAGGGGVMGRGHGDDMTYMTWHGMT